MVEKYITTSNQNENKRIKATTVYLVLRWPKFSLVFLASESQVKQTFIWWNNGPKQCLKLVIIRQNVDKHFFLIGSGI